MPHFVEGERGELSLGSELYMASSFIFPKVYGKGRGGHFIN